MATAAAKPLASVTRWAAYAQTSGKRWGIPPAVLLGLVDEETKGQEGLTSPTGAKGLTQFEPAAARTYGVDTSPGHAANQIDGAAHYLHDLKAQYGGNLHTALAAYAAGPGNLPAGEPYANNVLGHLAPLYGSVPAAGAAPAPSAGSAGAAPTASAPTSSALIDSQKRSGLLAALVTVGFVLVGCALLWQGTNQITGDGLKRAATTAAKAGAAA